MSASSGECGSRELDEGSGDVKENVWQYKPWWCQPWSIVLTGSAIVGGSWLLLHRIWVTGLVAVPILVWMGFFLVIYPKVMNEMIAEASAAQSQQDGESV